MQALHTALVAEAQGAVVEEGLISLQPEKLIDAL
jgi:hypothetical protein